MSILRKISQSMHCEVSYDVVGSTQVTFVYAKGRSPQELEALSSDIIKMVDYPATGCLFFCFCFFFAWSNRRTEDIQCKKLD